MSVYKKRSTKRRVAGAVAAGVLALTMTSCSASEIQSGQQAVVVDGSWAIPTDPKILGCIAPETSEYTTTNDVYRYPSRQISWDATGGSGSERSAYTVVSNISAPAELTVPVVVTFDLTTDCDKLSDFHRNFGTKYNGWLNEDGSVTQGWIDLLNYVIGQPLEQTLLPIAQKYTWQEIWNDEGIRVEFQQAVLKNLPTASQARTNGTEYFSGFQVTVLKPEPVNQDLKDLIEKEQAGIAEANGKKAAAEASVFAAQAETRQAEAEALKKQAEISGYPTVEAYLEAQMIEAGLNPRQPTYVVPQQK